MDLKIQQEKLDCMKWYDSQVKAEDQCGKYAFCVKCDKDDVYPCAKALHRYNEQYIRVAIIRRHR